ncbi:putative disease resistance protein RGA3 [Cocos nucifera]|uniref:Putative disease resistance protein RGA3 n=1 Tax=Cocos nucifera TaxID=13894 RepID=A0A8K0ILL4_COCNU|nr:putative disease resistance protein RGA3 [Cocos nucifera]
MMLGVKDDLKRLQRRMERISGFLKSAERKRYEDPNINNWVVELKDVMYDADDIIDRCMIEGRILLEKSSIHISGTKIEEDTQSLVESLVKEDNKKYRILGIVGMGGIGKTTLASNIYNHETIKNNFPMRVWVCVSKDFEEIKLLKDIIRSAGGKYGEAETKEELTRCLCSVLSKRFFIILDDVWEMDVWEDLLRIPFENAKANGKIVITTRDTDVARKMRADIHYVKKMDNDGGWEMLRKKISGDDDEEEEEISRLKEIGVQIVEKCDGLPLAIKVIAGVLRSKERSNLEWNKVLKSEVWSMSELDKELPGALFLSYEDLSSDLKQCFLYCSLFPEDSPLKREDLIRYWVAEGFVRSTQGNTLMEDVAEDYHRELIRRNILQPCNKWRGLSDQAGNYCKMHDLLRSLALFLTRDESIFLGDEQSPNTNPLSKLRRLSMVNAGERLEVPDVIKQQKCLRTLLVWSNYKTKMMIKNELFESLRFLRVMDLRDAGLENLPDSVGDLLHLRYLNVFCTDIKKLPESIGCLVNLQILNLAYCTSLHALPKAITKLCNLRWLRLEGTPLTHMPKGLGKSEHLNHLQGFVTGHDDRRDAQNDEGCDLKELQSLSQLRFLEINRLERTEPAGAPVLANSSFLRTLILNCEQPEDEEKAIAIQRIDKIYSELSPKSTHLQRLEINEFFGTGFPSWMMSPALNVSFPNLTNIRLFNCKSCPQLPPLGLLPQLKSLSIVRADAIKTIGPEFLGPRASSAATSFPKLEVLMLTGMKNWKEWSFGAIKTIGPEFLGPRASSAATSFPKLEELKFRWMDNWEEWSFGMVEGVGEERRGAPKLLPHLKELFLIGCRKLRALPPLGLLPQLKSLYIKEADAIETVGPEFLGPRASSAATSFPKLEELHFEDMENWKEWSFGMVEGGGEERRGAPKLLPHLMKLKLAYCPKLRALPQGLRHATNLQELYIAGVNNLKEINNLPSLKSLVIKDWSRLEHVENLDKLQLLRVRLPDSIETSTTDGDGQRERLPQWLWELLQNAPAAMQNLQKFKLTCSLLLLKTFLKDGPNWPIIQPIPQVEIKQHWHPDRSSSYVRYTKDPPTFEANVVESEESVD